MSPQAKSLRAVGVVLVLYALLCATHLGEFWPFSIYQMFSSAGRPWSRSVVTSIEPDVFSADVWRTVGMNALPGEIVALEQYGVAQNDLANYLEKTRHWNTGRIGDMETLFARYPTQEKHLLVYKVRGQLVSGDSISIKATPVLLIAADTTYLNPVLADASP
jgi:hypothetical protein